MTYLLIIWMAAYDKPSPVNVGYFGTQAACESAWRAIQAEGINQYTRHVCAAKGSAKEAK